MNCDESQIDLLLPFGNELVRIFDANGPDALDKIVTFDLPVGAHIEFRHVAGDCTIKYALATGAAPAPADAFASIFDVPPLDFNAVLNNKHWDLVGIFKDGEQCFQNNDIKGWNIPAATGAVNPQLNLDNAANRTILAAILD